MAKQLTLFDKPKKQPEPLTFTAPVCEGDHLSVHGLIYSTEPVEGWLEAKWLDIYRPPHKKRIADRAWIRPDTIASVEFYFVSPPGVVKVEDLDKLGCGDVGLMYYSPEHDTLFTKRRAMYREIDLRSPEVVGMLYYLAMYRAGVDRKCSI